LVGCAARPGPEVLTPVAASSGEKTLQIYVATMIAPVSRQIPWYQGILQGILLFWGSEAGLRCKKPLSCSDFSGNSLRGLSGKII